MKSIAKKTFFRSDEIPIKRPNFSLNYGSQAIRPLAKRENARSSELYRLFMCNPMWCLLSFTPFFSNCLCFWTNQASFVNLWPSIFALRWASARTSGWILTSPTLNRQWPQVRLWFWTSRSRCRFSCWFSSFGRLKSPYRSQVRFSRLSQSFRTGLKPSSDKRVYSNRMRRIRTESSFSSYLIRAFFPDHVLRFPTFAKSIERNSFE